MSFHSTLIMTLWLVGSGCATAQQDHPIGHDGAVQSDASAAPDATPADATPADAAGADPAPADAAAADSATPDAGPAWVAGKRKLSGAAYFFDAKAVGAIELQKDVTGATAYLLEFPTVSQPIAKDGSFTFEGLPEGGEFTVAVVHPDYYPSLSPLITIGTKDVTDVNFQVVTHLIAAYLGALIGFDAYDATQCQMVVTVTAVSENQGTWWAVGEPGATATIEPALTPEHGPFYFNTSTIPDKSLKMTTTDGGVLVGGAKPGIYTWTAHKNGMVFSTQRLKCVGGWLSNGVPPFGLQAGKTGG